MAYRGSGPPKFGTLGVSYTMPIPVKGGRTETFEPIQEVYTNVLQKLIPAERVLRFIGEYEFSVVPDATIQLLTTAYNMGRTIMWAPHSDLDKIRFEVIIDELKIVPVNGLIDYDGVQLKLRSVTVTNRIPNGDNMFRLGHRYPYLASVAVITAGAFVATTVYAIRTLGNTDFESVGATVVLANDCISGTLYTIKTVGTSDFTLIGALANTVGLQFVATGSTGGDGDTFETVFTASGIGSGTGTVIEVES